MKLHLSLLISLSALGSFACSDAPPQPPAVGIQVVMQNPLTQDNPDGRTCKAQPNGSRTYTVGAPNGDATVENGKDGVELSCTVRQNGGALDFELYAPNRTQGLTGTFAISMTGRVVAPGDATQNTASVGFTDPGMAGSLSNPPNTPCTLAPPPNSNQITLQPGAIFASFTCPLLINQGNPGDGCRGTGTFALEYCNTGEEEE